MTKLYRPHVPFKVRVLVATRQCYAAGFNPPAREAGESLASLLGRQLAALARAWKCDPGELRLDHDPPLGARPKHRRGLGKKTYYVPDANDPAHLFYRPHGPEHEGSHLIKTNVRGDHGQHPDRVLIKKARRAETSRGGETRRRSSGFPKPAARLKRAPDSRVKPRLPKWKWPTRKFQSRRRKP